MPDCKFDLRNMEQLDFDINMINCGGTWAAPLWMTPDYWQGGGASGEIDMMENCPTNAVYNNFAGGGSQVRVEIADPNSFQGHTTLWKQDDGNGIQSIHVRTCDPSDMLDGSCREEGSIAYYRDIYGANGCRGQNCMYTLISDIWNGYAGDDGYQGCTGGQTHLSSGCQTSVSNIRIKAATGTFTGKCSSMTGGSPPAPPPPPGSFELINLHSGSCIDIDSNGNFQDGTKAQLWQCQGVDGQKFEWSGNMIRNTHSGKCLDIDTNGNNQDGTKVQLWSCTGSVNQLWEWSGTELRNPKSGKCLDVDYGGNFQDGSKVQLWACNGGDAQLFGQSQAVSVAEVPSDSIIV